MDTDDIWNNFFGGGFDSIAKRMEKLFSDMGYEETGMRSYGYTMYQDSDGNRHVREFGDPEMDTGAESDMIGDRLTDVSLEKGAVRAIVEIPGVSKEDIVLEGTKNTLSIRVDTGHKKFAKTLELPCDVDPDSAVAEYNNGILEVTLTPVSRPEPKKRIGIQ